MLLFARHSLGNRIYRGFVLLIAVVCLASAPLGAIYVLQSRRDAEASPRWPSVDGTIRRANIDRRSYRNRRPYQVYRPLVEYDYQVAGKTYRGDRISAAALHKPIDGLEYGSQGYAELKLQQYAVGTTHPVYFDPSDPARSVLERGIGAGHDAGLWAVGILALMGTVLLYLLYGTSVLR